LRTAWIFALLPLLGCTSGSGPGWSPATHHEAVKSSPWVTQYSEALNAPTSPNSCPTLQRLGNDNSAPIAKLARTRFLERCTQNSGLAAAIAELDGYFDSTALVWLKPLVSEVIVNLATRANHRPTLAKYALLRAKDIGSQREKETLLQLGLSAARALGQAEKAAALESELNRVSPRLNPNPVQADWLRMADDFRNNEEWDSANLYYNKIINAAAVTVFDGFKARDGIRQVEKAKYRFYNGPLDVFLEASRQTAAYCERQVKLNSGVTAEQRRIMFEAWMQYARDVWSYGDVDVAKREVTRSLGLTWLDPVFKAYAYWLQARIHANYAEWSNSAASGVRATTILVSELANSAQWTDWNWMLWDESHWSAALAKRKLSRFDESADLLEEGLSRTKNPNTELKFLFWAAQGEFDSGRSANATANWQRLAQTDPHGFYGFMAYYKLGMPLQPLVPTDLTNVAKPSTMSDADYEILLWLTYSEETVLAQKYSKVIMSPTSVEVEDLVMRAFIKDFVTINSLVFTRIPAAQRNQFTTDHGSLFYPRPYVDIVRGAVANFPRIDEEYVYAVMRQESGFNTYARSWANAYGLIQLLPQVARDVQDEAGVHFTEDYELYRPEINLPLGVAHMDELIGQAGASFIMRTSAYNAKVEKALEWKERLYNGNIHEFLEEIPYDETRSYIRLVMRNYVMNKRLSATQPFLFPADLLSL
jgi:soluble lytic murein transglycosylase